MGSFTVTIEVGDAEGRNYHALDALVDNGASYLVVPRTILQSLGIAVSEQRAFTLAGGRQMQYDVGIASLRLDERVYPALTVFGEDGTSALLGAVALEIFGLVVEPVGQRLMPVSGLLMREERVAHA